MNSVKMKEPVKILQEWWRKIPKQVRLAFISAVIIGLATHLYGFVNLMPNHDGVAFSLITNQDMLDQGRWFQRIVMLLTSTYNMPWVNGCFSIIYLAIAVGLTVSVAGVQKKLNAIIIAGLMVTFPTIVSSFSYLYMADAFMSALLLTVFAVYISRKMQKFGFLIAAVCICLSLGIYQAYMCYAVALFVVLLIIDILKGEKTNKEIIIRGIKDFMGVALGVALYFVILKMLLHFTGKTLTNYQGINQIGISSVFNIFPQSIVAFKSFFTFFTKDIFTIYDIPAIIMYWGILVGTGFCGVYIFFKRRIWTNPLRTIILVILVILTPIALNSAYLLSAQYVHMLMIYSMVIVFVLLIRLIELFWEYAQKDNCKILASWAALMMAAVIVFNNFILSNQAYYSLQVNYNQTYANAIKITAHIEDFPDYHEGVPVAVVGIPTNAPVMNMPLTGFFFSSHFITYLPIHYYLFFRDYLGTKLNFVPDDMHEKIRGTQDFKSMPIYPAKGSIKMIGDVLVVKLGE